MDKMSASGYELNSSLGGSTGLINSEGHDVRSVVSSAPVTSTLYSTP